MTVLVVDRDRRLTPVAEALRSAGVGTVATVTDVGAAERAVESRAVDALIVADAPGTETADPIDGPAQVREVRTIIGEVTTLVYVLSNGHRPLVECFEAGADDVCRAPTERAELIARKVQHAAGVGGDFEDDATKFRSLMDSHPLDIFLKDEEGRFVSSTARSDIFEDLDREWVTNLTDYELLEPPFADTLYEEEQEILEREEAMVDKVEHYVDETGADRWISTTKAPRYDADGNLLGIVGSTLDVTEVKRQERLMAALHEASRRLTRAERPVDIARTTVDIAAEIGSLPRVQVALSERGELQPISGGREVRASKLSTPPFETHERWYRRAMKGDSLYVTRPGGSAPDLDDDVTVYRDDDVVESGLFVPLGEHGVVGFTDTRLDAFTVELSHVLAANLRAALDRASRERRLAETNERLREFALLGSHELRNRLQSAYGQLAQLDAETDSRRVQSLRRTVEGFDRIVTQLVTLARTGSVVETTQVVETGAIARTAWEQVDSAEATLLMADSNRIAADREALVELFGHLFRNAVEHAGPAVTVTVGALPDGDGFFVADDGPGIPPERLDAVFEFDYDDAARRSGYGLYIVSTIADAHGWSVEAARDGGARIEVRGVELAPEPDERSRRRPSVD
jgi:PAS domain S-box-containing protein